MAAGRDRAILDAAQSLFFDRGYHAVGINEIAERAGITGSAIYRYFSSKDEILGTLFDEALDALFAELARGGFVAGGDAKAEMVFLARTHARFAVAYQQSAAIMIRDESSLAAAHHRRYARRVRPYIARWTDCLQRAFPDRTPAEAATATAAVLSLLNSVGRWPRDARAAEDLTGLLADLAIGACEALGHSTREWSLT